ncbi:MAG: bifunctional phosphoglucose/phosphomannose isomerase, partial [Candidatus Omnitrophota bacterium]|nr:bifunctional phosphoglucose/phosphomannose isomerase [Candidatus Omnitrophota bacterium]
MGNILDDAKKIKVLDKSGMLNLLMGMDNQFREAKEIGENFKPVNLSGDGVNNIVFTGLGGSAIGADLVRSYTADEIKVPVIVNRNYTLPDFVDERTLLFVLSYSGNTEETLSAYKIARNKKAGIMAISSNGRLESLARQDGINFIKIPAGYPPRCALGYSFIPLLMALGKLSFIEDKSSEIDETVNVLSSLKDELRAEAPPSSNIAKEIALALHRKFPVIYGSNDHVDVAVTRWRGEFAENSKHLASSHLFPEMNHNEIVGWDFPSELLNKFVPVFLRDTKDHKRVAVRMDITK